MPEVLVDTSAWILAVFRRDRRAQDRLHELVATGRAAICPIVLLEWLAGRGDDETAAGIRRRLAAVPSLTCSDAVWRRAFNLAAEARRRGQTVPAPDSLVAAHAIEAGVTLLHADTDFVRIAAWSGLRQESLLVGP